MFPKIKNSNAKNDFASFSEFMAAVSFHVINSLSLELFLCFHVGPTAKFCKYIKTLFSDKNDDSTLLQYKPKSLQPKQRIILDYFSQHNIFLSTHSI